MTTNQLTVAEGAALIGAPEPVGVPEPVEQDQGDVIAKRFQQDTADHEMTVLHDDGLYRHLRFRSPKSSEYWFDLVTWPGCLTVRGDYGDAYTFTRLPDMFEFFRDKSGRIDPHYWAQKLDGHRQSAETYSEDAFRQIVCELFVSAVQCEGVPAGTGKAVRAEILDQDLFDEGEARKLLESFEYKGFGFGETWEFTFSDYERDFLWACHAIVWGIARYDAQKTTAGDSETASAKAAA